MATALLITRDDIVRFTAVNGNVDTDKFIQFVKIAQDIHIQTYLGTKLLEKIQTLIIANTLTGNYELLTETYVKPMLIHWSMVEYLPFAAYTIANKGVYKHSSESAENSLKWVNSLELDGKKGNLELTGYVNRIQNYIYLNPTGQTFVSLRGTFNVYEYLQANALFYGIDLSGSYGFGQQWEGYFKGSLIRAKNMETQAYFPFIPSDRMDVGLSEDFLSALVENN